jgi:CDP-4-dehydro-6-deoxyglucose reductase, E3
VRVQEFRLPFTVTIQPSTRQFLVESGESILAAAIRQGIGLTYSCRDGVCGTCRCHILEGEVRALDQHPEAIEAGTHARICVACAVTDIVLESTALVAAGTLAVQKIPCRVVGIHRVAPDVAILRLETPRNRLLEYHPGQYVELSLRDGTRRKFSLATAHGRDGIEFHIRHLPSGRFSGHVFGALREKDVLHLEGPFGTFMLRESGRPVVLLASGTGFAPIKAILEQIEADAIRRPVALYWGCRRRADLYLDDYVQRKTRVLPNLHYVPVLSDPHQDDGWQGRTGLVHRAVMQDLPDLSDHEVYACGVPIMVESARADFTKQCRLAVERFFADAFVPGHEAH